METYKNVSQDIRDQLNAKAEAVQIILTGIDNDIYSTVDACLNACEMWKAIERFYKMMNELIRNQCDVTNHQVNVQFLLQLQPEWQMFVILVKQSQELNTVSYHKLYDILKQHQNEVNEIRAERIARTANPLALVAKEQPDNSPRINRSIGYENQRIGNVVGARETVGSTVVQKSGIQCYNYKEFGHVARECPKPKRVKDAAYHREKMLLCKQEEAGIQLNAEQADCRDDTDDESEDQELEAHYMYMVQLQEVSPDVADSGPIFDTEPMQKVSTDDHYNVFAIESEHPEQSESVHDTYPIEQDEHNVIIDSLDMSYDREQIEQNDDDADLVNEYFKNKNKSLESSNNCFKEANNKLSETNNLLYNDFKKSQAELARRNDVEHASKVEIDCAKARGDLISYKMESQKSFNRYTQMISDLNHTIYEMKEKLCAHQETISILSQQKEAQIKLYKTREDNELDKVIALENKVKKAQRANPRLHDIGCYNDNLALILAPESDEVIRLEKESRLKLSDLIRPFDYEKLNNLYDLFIPQREKSSKQRYFSERSRLSHTPVNNGNSKEFFYKQTTLLEKRMDESIPWDQKCKISIELFKIKSSVGTIFDGAKRIIPTTSVSGPQLKSNQIEDRVLHNHSQGKKHDVEDHRRSVKFSKNKMSVTACNDSLNAKTLNVNFVTKMPIAMPVSTREPKHTVKQFVAEPFKKTVASESNKKPRNITRKLYERVSKACSWWYPKFTPSGYKWKPKSEKENVNPNLVESVLFIVDFGCSKHMTGNLKLLINFVEKFLGTIKFGNDQIASILGYGDQSKAYRVFNKRTRVIVETIHVNFDELPQMASDHVSSDPAPECQRMALEHDNLSPGRQCQENVPYVAETVTMSNELDLLFSSMFDELLNGSSHVVSKSSAVTTADAPNQSQQQQTTPLNNHITHDPTCQVPTHAPTVASTENMNQAEMVEEYAQVENDEFINIFFRTRRQLELDGEMCMFALTVSRTEPKNVKEAMADSTWIESMQEELHQFDRLDALYGFKQAPRAWYDELSNFLASKGFSKDQMKYRSMLGAIMYLTASRPDIMHAACYCARYQAKPTEKHLTAVKRIFQYLKYTIHMGLWYPKDTGFELTAFLDSDHAGCLDSLKSTSGGIQFLGGDKLVSWSSKKQDCTSMSSAEAEYVSLSA
nr:uncharacterized mitochondrial protein AtMg00810-like [Tanacetum cinerariifolium]